MPARAAISSIGQMPAPQNHAVADIGHRHIGQIDINHVHRYAADERHPTVINEHRRAGLQMPRIAIAIADSHNANDRIALPPARLPAVPYGLPFLTVFTAIRRDSKRHGWS